MRRAIMLVLAASVCAYGTAALAQSEPGAPGSNQVIPEKDRSSPRAQPPGEPLSAGRSESLSERLDAGDGVIKPKPGIDPGIVKAAPVPDPNSTPVIPPPGMPGPEPK